MNNSSRPQQRTGSTDQQHTRRTGLLPARIGTTHAIEYDAAGPPGKDGKPGPVTRRSASLTVKDATQRKAGPDGLTVRCLTCGKESFDLAELAAAHPSAADMRKRGESHVWAYAALDGLKEYPPTEIDMDLAPDIARAQFNALQVRQRNAVAAAQKSDTGLFAEPAVDL